jgi:hypothetical protein
MESKLSTKEQIVIELVLAGKNGVTAAREAGYKGTPASLSVIASRIMQHKRSRERITARLAEHKVTADEVLATISAHMRYDITDLFTYTEDQVNEETGEVIKGTSKFDLKHIHEVGLGHLIKKVSFHKDSGEVAQIEGHSQLEAAKTLARILGIEAPDAERSIRAAAETLVLLSQNTDNPLTQEQAEQYIRNAQQAQARVM